MNRYVLSLWKKLTLSLCTGMIFHGMCFAQNNTDTATQMFDTALNNNGFAMYNLSFPKFNPDSGVLVSVKISTSVSANYGFTLTNVNSSAATYQLSIGQEDQISGSYGVPYMNLTPQNVGTYNLTPGQSQVTPPFVFLSNHVSSDSITNNVTPFMGNGSVHINYMSFTYTNLIAYNNASYYYGNTVNTSAVFSIQYLFKRNPGTLAANLTRWSARLSAPLTVQLDWSAVNETAVREYDIQRSSDGRNFTTIATLPATTNGAIANGGAADYSYIDHLPDGTIGNLYYRLQMHDQGKTSYSQVRELNIAASEQGLHIYPNPATDYINIATGGANSDWQVDIISASGALVQRGSFLQASTLHVPFSTRLAAGTYFLRLTDLHGQTTRTLSFVVRGGN
ncbi:T9SS type A sorting domain-containing protein [Puia dinghuensis]|uniref:Secretion system C-terminal sorting domain-containing protein n=1 Tax=Puia dinghuensis TaxID=1792502 RepID=A0A8J2XUU1_9BACT|nr:T9SS type A sorting domain-containing protein [Puia dinghuensis]GGB14318.1 hypothetical protein GCM10011511_42650 [Puia dinghuensis]